MVGPFSISRAGVARSIQSEHSVSLSIETGPAPYGSRVSRRCRANDAPPGFVLCVFGLLRSELVLEEQANKLPMMVWCI